MSYCRLQLIIVGNEHDRRIRGRGRQGATVPCFWKESDWARGLLFFVRGHTTRVNIEVL